MIRFLLIAAVFAVACGVGLVADEAADPITVEGTVQAIDAEAGTLTVKPAAGKAVAVVVDVTATVTVDGEEGTLAGVAIGDTAVVTYTTEDELRLASRVDVTKAAPPEDPPEGDME